MALPRTPFRAFFEKKALKTPKNFKLGMGMVWLEGVGKLNNIVLLKFLQAKRSFLKKRPLSPSL